MTYLKGWRVLARGCWVLALCGLCLLSACESALLHDLDEAEATRLAALLERHHIPASLERAGDSRQQSRWTLNVPEGELGAARALLTRYRLPTRSEPRLEDEAGLLGPSRARQHHQLERERARAIERTLTRLEGVIGARVHLNLPEAQAWAARSSAPLEGEASVLLLHQGEAPPEPAAIKALVAGSSSALTVDDVTVLIDAVAVGEPGDEDGLAKLGPWRVAGSSHGSLLAVLLSLIGAVVMTWVGAAWWWLRARAGRRSVGSRDV